MKRDKEIDALVRLMEDPDEMIYQNVKDKLFSFGTEIIPFLEHSWENEQSGLIFQSRIENLIHEIQFDETKAQLCDWVNSAEKDLLVGALVISKYQYPGINEVQIKEFIFQLRRDVWLELNDSMTSFEIVHIFNRVFFGLYHFHGDAKNYNSPVNSFLNTVIESRKGNPLSLCLLYSIVAQSLDIPIYGVNLPNHFILAYMDENGTSKFLDQKIDYGVLFYVNAFSKGTVFGSKEIKEFLDSLNLPHTRQYFEPCSNSDILRRMITNLISSFQQVGNLNKVEELNELRNLIP
ncbi:MAG: transglutaminase-like domain-containing protein [Bacteroidota bacterium]